MPAADCDCVHVETTTGEHMLSSCQMPEPEPENQRTRAEQLSSGGLHRVAHTGPPGAAYLADDPSIQREQQGHLVDRWRRCYRARPYCPSPCSKNLFNTWSPGRGRIRDYSIIKLYSVSLQ